MSSLTPSSQQGRNLVILGPDYDRHPSGIQHLTKNLVHYRRILWVETIGARPPRLTMYDLKRTIEKIGSWLKPSKKLPQAGGQSDFLIINPVILPFNQFGVVRLLNRFMLRSAVSKAIDKMQLSNFTVVATDPSHADVINDFDADRTLYYCIDDWANWPGMHPALTRKMEEKLLPAVDQTIVSSDRLAKICDRPGKPVPEIITHGVDVDHFGSIRGVAPAQATAPVFTYFGLFDERSDQELLVKIAKKWPSCTVDIVGTAVCNVDLLKTQPNIRLRGPIVYSELPSAVSQTNVFLLPYIRDELAESINPIKIKEYMATGRPTVATDLPEVAKFSDHVSVCSNHDQFLAAIERYLTDPDAFDADASFTRAQQESWQVKCDKFSELADAGCNATLSKSTQQQIIGGQP